MVNVSDWTSQIDTDARSGNLIDHPQPDFREVHRNDPFIGYADPGSNLSSYSSINGSSGLGGGDADFLSERDMVPDDLPSGVKAFFIISYTLIMVLSVVGNLLVLIVVIGRRKMRTVTNTFLVSLAVSDLLIASLNMPFQLRFHLTNEWTMGEGLCKFTNYIQGVTIVASIFTLTGIAADRYYAICHPLRARHVHTIKRAMIILTFFWILAFTLVSPQLIIQRIEPLLKRQPDTPHSAYNLKVVTVCVEYFGDFRFSATYTIIFYVVLYLMPVIVMFGTYGKIAYTLWIREPIGETPEGSHDRRLMEKKRVVRMLLVIMILFAVSWFPFFTCHVYLLWQTHGMDSFRITMAVFQLFGYSNSCSNPIVYCFLNQSFRQNFLKSICISSRRRNAYTSAFSMDNDRSGKFETTNNSILTDQDTKYGNKYEMSSRNSKELGSFHKV